MTDKYFPDYMTEESKHTLLNGYLQEGENFYGAINRISNSAASYLAKEGMESSFCESFKKDLYEVIEKGYLGLASPVFSNLGIKNRSLPISCFSVSVPDSVSGIFDTLQETAIMTKSEGGVGVFFGNVRGAGSPISSGGNSLGTIPFSKLYDSTASVVSQGKLRRGSFAIYLPIEHPDVKKLLIAKDHTTGDSRGWIDSNIAVTITDKWIKEMLAGDEEKKELFSLVITTRLKVGSPYILFIDNVNNNNPKAYKNNNLKVETSNLCCLSGDMLVPTIEYGNIPIQEIVEEHGGTATIFDGNKWVKTNTFREFKKSFLYRIELQNGSHIDMTWNHRNLLQNKKITVLAKDLRIGDKLQYSSNVPIKDELDAREFTIVNISRLEGPHRTFCCTVPSTTFFELSNGVLTGNSEITLYTDSEHSFVCCLSSLNLDKYDEWRGYTTPRLGLSVPYISAIFLDAVLSEFIDKASNIPELQKAVRSAVKGRALGLGTMGLASLYQKRMLPFSSPEAFTLNIEVHKFISHEAKNASRFLALKLGEPEWCKGTRKRNSHLTATAPTRTNSVICNAVSQGIEPIDKNYFVAKQDKGVYIRKNPNLAKLLKEKYNRDDNYTWDLISKNKGSVKDLDFLSDYEKEVFATAREIDQKDLVRQAADRQKYICQSQSLNLFVDPHATEQYLVELHLMAWNLGVKSLYYLRSRSKQTMDTLNYIITKNDCPWCVKLKEELDSRKVEYEEIPLSEAKRRGLWKNSYKTVPQLFYGSEHVGGYTDYMQKYVYGNAGIPMTNVIDGEIPINLDFDEEHSDCKSCEG